MQANAIVTCQSSERCYDFCQFEENYFGLRPFPRSRASGRVDDDSKKNLGPTKGRTLINRLVSCRVSDLFFRTCIQG